MSDLDTLIEAGRRAVEFHDHGPDCEMNCVVESFARLADACEVTLKALRKMQTGHLHVAADRAVAAAERAARSEG